MPLGSMHRTAACDKAGQASQRSLDSLQHAVAFVAQLCRSQACIHWASRAFYRLGKILDNDVTKQQLLSKRSPGSRQLQQKQLVARLACGVIQCVSHVLMASQAESGLLSVVGYGSEIRQLFGISVVVMFVSFMQYLLIVLGNGHADPPDRPGWLAVN